jgi:energy-coupling factor transport system permease protein
MQTLHLDPRTMILATTGLIVATLFSRHILALGGLVLLLIIAFVLFRTPFRRFLRNMLLLSWLLGVTFIINFWGNFEETNLSLHSVGNSLLAVARLITVVGWGTLLGAVLSPLEMVAGLERLLAPLRALRLPIHTFSLVAMLSVRFLPIFFEEQQTLMRAHIARGIDFSAGNFFERLKHYGFFCVPLFNSMLRHVDHLAIAMDARAFRVSEARTVLCDLRMTWVDCLVLGGGMMVLAGTQFLF